MSVQRTQGLKKSHTPNRGFTILELLVVIAIIGILAAVIFANLGAARKRADAAQMLSQLQEIEKALKVYMLSEGKEAWPTFAPVRFDDYTIQKLVDTGGPPPNRFAGFSAYMTQTPPDLLPGTTYSYWNTVPSNPYSCSNSATAYSSGVSVRVGVTSGPGDPYLAELFDIIDSAVDLSLPGGVLPQNCGRIRMGGTDGSLYYLIAINSNDI